MLTSIPRAIGCFRSRDQGQGLPVAADRLAVLAEPGVHESPAHPTPWPTWWGRRSRGSPPGPAGRSRAPARSSPGERGISPRVGQGPPLPGLVAGLPEQRQGLLGLRDRLGPVALHAVGAAGEQVRPGLAGQVTGAAEVVQGLGQVGAVLVVSAGERAVPADDRVGPAQRGLVARRPRRRPARPGRWPGNRPSTPGRPGTRPGRRTSARRG